VKPLDAICLHAIFKKYETIITIEDGVIIGGFGSAIVAFSAENHYSNTIKTLGVPDVFIEQGTIEQQQQMCGIDVVSLQTLFSTY